MSLLSLALVAALAGPSQDETWSALAEAPPGTERAHRLAAALREQGDEPLAREHLDLAWRIGVDESRAFRFDLAVEIQSLLHERSAAAWSASDLALSLSRAGRYEEGAAVLTEQLSRGEDAFLRARLGLLHLGAGRERDARNELGKALAAGSEDAALILGRMALDEGARDTARALFRGQLMEGSGGAWALRGWGLTLLRPNEPEAAPPAAESTRRDETEESSR